MKIGKKFHGKLISGSNNVIWLPLPGICAAAVACGASFFFYCVPVIDFDIQRLQNFLLKLQIK